MHARHRTLTVLMPVMIVWAVGLTLLSWRTGVQHDYPYYLQQWALIGTDVSPWATDQGFPPNTYGPLHALFAHLTLTHPLAPKVLFTGLFAVACVVLSREVIHVRPDMSTRVLLVALIPANMLVLTVAGVQGDNDVLVAALVAFAILLKFRQHTLIAGVLLGLAALVKYYPAVVLVLICLDRRSWDWRPMVGGLMAIVPIVTLSLLTWGTEFLDAIVFGGSRAATYLSPLRALDYLDEGEPSVFVDWLARVNSVMVVLVLVLAIGLAYALRLNWLQASTVGLWAVLVSYKVGHAQYYLSLVVLLALLLAFDDVRSRRIVIAFLPFVAFLETFQTLYWLQSQGAALTDLPLGDLSGIPTAFFAAGTVLGLAWALRPTTTEIGAISGQARG